MATTPHINEVALSALAYGQPMWAPDEADGAAMRETATLATPDHAGPRGNGSVHEADLERGREQLGRVLGH